MRAFFTALFAAGLMLFGASAASAADWTITKLRGTVVLLVDGEWQPLARGAVVPEHRIVRTLGGRVTLQRGKEIIELGPQTQISIDDKAGARPFTTVTQHFGQVAVEAEVKDVRHFAVETPFLVAVVKGTRFVVKSDREQSIVTVRRGAVLVVDSESSDSVTVVAGQSAAVEEGEQLTVAGRGHLPDVVDSRGRKKEETASKGKDGHGTNTADSGNAGAKGQSEGKGSSGSSGNGPGANASGNAAENSSGNSSNGSGHGKSPV